MIRPSEKTVIDSGILLLRRLAMRAAAPAPNYLCDVRL